MSFEYTNALTVPNRDRPLFLSSEDVRHKGFQYYPRTPQCRGSIPRYFRCLGNRV